MKSKLEQKFEQRWGILADSIGVPMYSHTEYQFHDIRKWRFDFVWEYQKVAVECEGGIGTGRHTTVIGFEKDCEKYNTATASGWQVFKVSASMLTEPKFMKYLLPIAEYIIERS